jgi:hypothetical protein
LARAKNKRSMGVKAPKTRPVERDCKDASLERVGIWIDSEVGGSLELLTLATFELLALVGQRCARIDPGRFGAGTLPRDVFETNLALRHCQRKNGRKHDVFARYDTPLRSVLMFRVNSARKTPRFLAILLALVEIADGQTCPLADAGRGFGYGCAGRRRPQVRSFRDVKDRADRR